MTERDAASTRGPARHHGGFSLVELMVAITIGLLLMTGLVSLVVNTNRSYGELAKASRQLENGRYAVQLLVTDIQHAGFYGEFYQLASPPATLPSPCETALAELRTALPLPIQGYNGAVTSPIPACVSDANYQSGTDILVIRRAATVAASPLPPAASTLASLTSGEVYLQTRGDTFVLNVAANPPASTTSFNLTEKDGTTLADIRKYHVSIYFISPCSIPSGSNCDGSADGGNPIPTLKRLDLTTDGTNLVMTRTPLAEGIENLQIEYGIDRDGDGAPNETDVGDNDAYVQVPADSAAWSNVVSVRLFLLARNIESTPGYTDTKTYNLGLAGSSTPGGAYKRHVFSAVVRLINPSSRRET